MTTARQFWVALVAAFAVAGAVVVYALLNDGGKSEQEKRADCLYAAIEQAPSLRKGQSVFDHVGACRSLPRGEQQKIQSMMITFVESTLSRLGE